MLRQCSDTAAQQLSYKVFVKTPISDVVVHDRLTPQHADLAIQHLVLEIKDAYESFFWTVW